MGDDTHGGSATQTTTEDTIQATKERLKTHASVCMHRILQRAIGIHEALIVAHNSSKSNLQGSVHMVGFHLQGADLGAQLLKDEILKELASIQTAIDEAPVANHRESADGEGDASVTESNVTQLHGAGDSSPAPADDKQKS